MDRVSRKTDPFQVSTAVFANFERLQTTHIWRQGVLLSTTVSFGLFSLMSGRLGCQFLDTPASCDKLLSFADDDGEDARQPWSFNLRRAEMHRKRTVRLPEQALGIPPQLRGPKCIC
jgi:hypothetical protein